MQRGKAGLIKHSFMQSHKRPPTTKEIISLFPNRMIMTPALTLHRLCSALIINTPQNVF